MNIKEMSMVQLLAAMEGARLSPMAQGDFKLLSNEVTKRKRDERLRVAAQIAAGLAVGRESNEALTAIPADALNVADLLIARLDNHAPRG